MCCVYCNPPALLKDSLHHSYLNRCWRSTLLCRQWSAVADHPNVVLCKLSSVSGQLWGRQDDCCWVESSDGLEGPQTHSVHGVMSKCTSVMESGSPFFGWQVKMSVTLWLALNLLVMSLYHCLDDHINFVDLEGKPFTHLLLLPDLLMYPV